MNYRLYQLAPSQNGVKDNIQIQKITDFKNNAIRTNLIPQTAVRPAWKSNTRQTKQPPDVCKV